MDAKSSIVASKSGITTYLQAAAEIEKDIYTMEATLKNLEEKISENEATADDIIRPKIKPSGKVKDESHLKKIEQARDARARTRSNYNVELLELHPTYSQTNYTYKDFYEKITAGYIIATFFMMAIITVFLGLPFWLILNKLVEIGELYTFVFYCIIQVCPFGLTALRCTIIKKRRIKKAKIEAQKANADNKKANERAAIEKQKMLADASKKDAKERSRAQAEYDTYVSYAKDLQTEADYCRRQADDLRKALATLRDNRAKLYSINIIPPDYRKLDCVCVLHQIFRNDLADTIRDAVLLYEERAFRGEVIRGIDNISRQIGNLSSLMLGIKGMLGDIKTEVKFLSNDVYQVYQQNQAKATRDEKIYEETKLTRYAAESLKKSNEKVEKFFDELMD